MTEPTQIASHQHVSENDETAVIRRATAGDADAFEHLYRVHKTRIYALCMRMMGNADLAEEATQDTFMLAFQHLATFRGAAKFSTWLYQVARNTVLMNLRHTRVQRVELSVGEMEDDQESSSGLESLAGPSINLVTRIQLERAIATLPAGYRMMFILHDVEEYEHHEIAEMLGCTEGTVKSQLHRARKKLRRHLLGDLKPTKRSAPRVHQSLGPVVQRCMPQMVTCVPVA
jgi:RNA polymerase sigma-70 factor (ECF subfamily)